MDREKIIKSVHDARRYLEDKEWVDKSVGVHIDALNDAIALLKEQEEVIKTLALYSGMQAILSEKEKPEIVYCCECKWNSEKSYDHYCQSQSRKRKPDWYCADGVKKDE